MAKAQHKDEQKKESFALPKEVRLMMISSLESTGDFTADNEDDEQVLKRYNQYVLDMESKIKGFQVTKETKSLNDYVNIAKDFGDIRVDDKNFVARLFKLNIHPRYLHIFRKEDTEIAEGPAGDRQLWRVVNKSGLSAITDVSQLTKMRRSAVKQKAMR
jgi:hypothetical protein